MTEQAIALYNVALLANVTNRVKQIKPNQMKKQINATGVNGTFTGWVDVLLDNPTKTWVTIVGTVENEMLGFQVLDTDEHLLSSVDEMEMCVKTTLFDMANQNNDHTSIESQLKAKGFV